MEIKAFQAKSIEDGDGTGLFEAIVSVFGNVDAMGDRVEPGAFADSLEKGLPPVVWSHRWDEPPIGTTLEATETNEGLRVLAQLNLDNELAAKVYGAMMNKGGDGRPALREFSFAYDVVDAEYVKADGADVYSLKTLDLIEVGPCLKGVNDATRLVGVKGIDRIRPERPTDDAESFTDAQAAQIRKARDLLTMTVQPIRKLGDPGDGSR